MKPKSLIIFIGLILLAALTVACSEATPEATPESAESVAATMQQPKTVSAEAFVVPVREANLAFEGGGRVVVVNVSEGEEVTEGTVLAKLDDKILQAQLANTDASVAQAEVLVSKAEAAIPLAEASVAQAEAALVQAQASLNEVKSGATAEQIAQAQAGVAQAEASLAQRVAGPTAEDIAQVEAAVETARASLALVLAGSRDEDLQAASATLLQAEANVRLAQADYDKVVYGDPDVAEPFGIALQQATLSYDAAQATYNKLLNGATDEEIAISRARVNEAEAALAKVNAGATPEQIAQAQAGVEQAQAALAEMLAGATDEQIAIAEAGVVSAEAGIGSAEANVAVTTTDVDSAAASVAVAQSSRGVLEVQMEQTELVAPFDGVVGSLDLEAGEIVQPGAPSVILGDTSRWQIETDDLTEIDVVRVKVGRSVMISVDALPDEEFEGEVVRIKPKSETKAGDVTYSVLIDITKGPVEKLMWGMTTFVDIEAGPDL